MNSMGKKPNEAKRAGKYPIDKYDLLEQALAICKKGGMVTLEDVIAFLPCCKSTFFNCFPSGSPEHEQIIDALNISKRKACVSIRGRLYNSDNPTALITVYKMLCTEEERNAISMSRTDITSKGEQIKSEPLVVEIIDKAEQVEKKE